MKVMRLDCFVKCYIDKWQSINLNLGSFVIVFVFQNIYVCVVVELLVSFDFEKEISFCQYNFFLFFYVKMLKSDI